MTLEDLIAEGEALKKPCFYLGFSPTPSGIVGYWGGERSDMPNELPPEVSAFSSGRHIVTLHESLFAELDLIHDGPIGLFGWEFANDNGWQYRVEHDQRLSFANLVCTGEPLYATPAQSFPPFPAVCLHGSDRMAAWLDSLGLARHDYWQVPSDDVEEYDWEFEDRSEFYNSESEVAVIVGGWHRFWPEDDFYIPAELRHLFLTLRDAEPWFEGWHSPMSRGCHARARIT